jgi:hypothetical protein
MFKGKKRGKVPVLFESLLFQKQLLGREEYVESPPCFPHKSTEKIDA